LSNSLAFKGFPVSGQVAILPLIPMHSTSSILYFQQRVPEKNEATFIFDITLPSVETFLKPFLKHFVHK